MGVHVERKGTAALKIPKSVIAVTVIMVLNMHSGAEKFHVTKQYMTLKNKT